MKFVCEACGFECMAGSEYTICQCGEVYATAGPGFVRTGRNIQRGDSVYPPKNTYQVIAQERISPGDLVTADGFKARSDPPYDHEQMLRDTIDAFPEITDSFRARSKRWIQNFWRMIREKCSHQSS